jgi:hypothetical protein
LDLNSKTLTNSVNEWGIFVTSFRNKIFNDDFGIFTMVYKVGAGSPKCTTRLYKNEMKKSGLCNEELKEASH